MIYSWPFEGCWLARDGSQVQAALRRFRQAKEPNYPGMESVRRILDPDPAQRFADLIRRRHPGQTFAVCGGGELSGRLRPISLPCFSRVSSGNSRPWSFRPRAIPGLSRASCQPLPPIRSKPRENPARAWPGVRSDRWSRPQDACRGASADRKRFTLGFRPWVSAEIASILRRGSLRRTVPGPRFQASPALLP